MAFTYAYSSTVNHWRAYIGYELSNVSDTQTKVTVVAGIQDQSWGFQVDHVDSTLTATDRTALTVKDKPFHTSTGSTTMVELQRYTYTYSRAASAATKTASNKVTNHSGYMDGTATASISFTIPAAGTPSAPTGVSASVSGTKATVRWTSAASTAKPWKYVLISRKVNGGSWERLSSTVSPTATSYADTLPADSYAVYSVAATNGTNTSAWVNSSTVYVNPSAPTKVTAARLSETSVSLAMTSSARTADAIEWQASADGSTWGTATKVSGANLKTATVAPGVSPTGTWRFRVRYLRGTYASAWSPASNEVVVLCAPAAPTISAPVSGEVVPTDGQPPTVSFTHHSIDGSAQTKYEAQWRVNGGAWQTRTESSAASSFTDAGMEASAGDTVEVRVRTWGAFADPSPYSAVALYYVKARPSVNLTSPDEDVTTIPFDISFDYSDESGTQASATVTVYDGGAAVFSRSLGSETTVVVDGSNWLPQNGATYDVEVSARSTSSLSTSQRFSFSTDWTEPMAPTIDASFDADTGRVSILVGASGGEGDAIASVSVYRLDGGVQTLIADGLEVGSEAEDEGVPINREVTYRAVAFSAAMATSQAEQALKAESGRLYAYAGGSVAVAELDPKLSKSVARPDKRTVRYAGRRLPVSYDTDAVEVSYSISFSVADDDGLAPWLEVMESGGRAVVKTWTGDVALCDVSVDAEPFSAGMRAWHVSVSATVVDGD